MVKKSKLRLLLGASLTSLFFAAPLTLASCWETKNESEAVITIKDEEGVVSEISQTQKEQENQLAAQRERLADALSRKEEAKKVYDESNKELAEKQEQYKKVQNELTSLKESDQINSAKVVIETTDLEAELQVYNREYSDTRENIQLGFDHIKPTVVKASSVLNRAEEEIKNLREFSFANKGSEALLYLFGFKWFWGLFIGYRVTSFTYQPDLAKDLLQLLTKIRGDVSMVATHLESGLVKLTPEATREEVNNLTNLVKDDLDLLAKNQDGLSTESVKQAKLVLEKLKSVLELATDLADEQANYEATQVKLDNIQLERKNFLQTVEDKEREATDLYNQIQVLIEEVNHNAAVHNQAARELEVLQSELEETEAK